MSGRIYLKYEDLAGWRKSKSLEDDDALAAKLHNSRAEITKIRVESVQKAVRRWSANWEQNKPIKLDPRYRDALTVLDPGVAAGWFSATPVSKGSRHAQSTGQGGYAPEEKRAALSKFIREINPSDIDEFMIVCITGATTVRSFLAAIEHHLPNAASIPCKILLRSKFSVDKRRGEAIDNTIASLDNVRARYPQFQFEVRSYACAFPLYAVMCKHKSGKYSGVFSSYLWLSQNSRETMSGNEVDRRLSEANDSVVDLYMRWFEHFWGRNKIHTVILDFDDTLCLTTGAQVKAWLAALGFGLKTKLFNFNNVRAVLARTLSNDQAAVQQMTEIFLNEQEEEKILRQIFTRPLQGEVLAIFTKRRLEERERLTKIEAKPISGIVSDIRELHKEYQLVIVSATSEKLITGILVEKKLNIFSYVLGKEAPRQQWQDVENKAQHFIRLSSMLGIPLDRMAFVGDSYADFRAANQLGIHFIENKHNAGQYDRESLIPSRFKPTYKISRDARAGELIAQLKKIEADMASG